MTGTGYQSIAFAQALGSIGTPLPLGATGGHVLRRAIPDSDETDLMGPYPLFSCPNWDALAPAIDDLRATGKTGSIPADLSVTLVTDPFCPFDQTALEQTFDHVVPLHQHLLIDLAEPLEPSRHHRRKLRKAGPARIEAGAASAAYGDDWVRLYGVLAEKKGMQDLRRFNADSLVGQLTVPGAHLVTAWDEADQMIGANLYYLQGDVAYSHLLAYSDEGYARSVSFPMLVAAFEYFAPQALWINLGGVPAAADGGKDEGVGRFKRGWANIERPTYLCGAILNNSGYSRLSNARVPGGTTWFPAYRAGQFG